MSVSSFFKFFLVFSLCFSTTYLNTAYADSIGPEEEESLRTFHKLVNLYLAGEETPEAVVRRVIGSKVHKERRLFIIATSIRQFPMSEEERAVAIDEISEALSKNDISIRFKAIFLAFLTVTATGFSIDVTSLFNYINQHAPNDMNLAKYIFGAGTLLTIKGYRELLHRYSKNKYKTKVSSDLRCQMMLD